MEFQEACEKTSYLVISFGDQEYKTKNSTITDNNHTWIPEDIALNLNSKSCDILIQLMALNEENKEEIGYEESKEKLG